MMNKKYKAQAFCGVSILLISFLPARGQDETSQQDVSPLAQGSQPIKTVRFEGLAEISETFCQNRIVTAAGQQPSAQTLEEDRRRLIRTGKFLDVQYEIKIEAGHNIVIFRVKERPAVLAVEFAGNAKFSDKELLKEVDLRSGDPLNTFKIQQGISYIEQLYREAGYADVVVGLNEDLLRDENQVVYTIEEGVSSRVKSISFEGNTAFSKSELLSRIITKTYIPVFRAGNFNPDQLERDIAELQNFYRDRGYLDAQVSYRQEAMEATGNLAAIFVIDEGELYRIALIEFENNSAFADEELLGVMRLQPGDIMRQDFLVKDLGALKSKYGEVGYLYSSIMPARVFTEEPGQVNLKFTIVEEAQYTVGRVVIRGNSFSKDKVIRRELEFFPDELFNTELLKQSERNIRATQLFKFAKVTPVGQQDDIRDVIVDVEEVEQTTQFIIAGGVGSNSGLAGSLSFESRNFDIFDWPRSWGEFIRGRSFRGAGQYFRLQVSPGTELSSFRIDFRESYLMDKPVRLGTSFYLFERTREDYDERRLGMNISLGKYFDEGFLEGWSGELAFRLETVKIDGLRTFPAKDIADVKGNNLIGSVKGRLTRNRTDSRFFPTNGDRFSVALEQAGGDHTFTKAEVEYTWYKTITVDELDRPSVLALKGDVGYIFGDAPVFERFYAGGIGSVRGFEYRGISPRDGFWFDDDQRIGGNFKVLTGAEYSFPLWTNVFRGVLFSDMGTVEEDFELTSWRASVGLGLRIYVERLGPIPFEFNLAWPMSSESEDDTQVFSFALGITF